MTWTLAIESRGTTAAEGVGRADGRLNRQKPRTVTLSLPTPPHWGAAVWRGPEGWPPSVIVETGPLAEQARAVLDHGIWAALDELFSSVIAGPAAPFSQTGYEWSIGGGREGLHRIVVTQAGGRARVFRDLNSGATGRRRWGDFPPAREPRRIEGPARLPGRAGGGGVRDVVADGQRAVSQREIPGAVPGEQGAPRSRTSRSGCARRCGWRVW